MGHATDDLAGTRWRVSDAPEAPVLDHLDERAAPTLSFADGRVTGFSGCNLLSGSYARDGDRLSLGPLITTMKACPHPADVVERTFLDRLHAAITASVVDGTLVLRDGKAHDVLHFDPVPALILQGSAWLVTAINNGREAVIGVTGSTSLTLSFSAGSTVAGDTGCNRFRGTMSAGPDDALTFGPLLTTRRACSDAQAAEQEAAYLSAMTAVRRVRADHGELALIDEHDAVQVSLVRAWADSRPT